MKQTKRKVGRPVKYTDEFIEKEAIALIEYVVSTKIPYLKDFCFIRGYPSQYITDVFTRVPKFSEALLLFKDKFESIIVRGSLEGRMNAFMAMNTLKNCSGWRDKQEHEHTGLEIKIVNVTQTDSKNTNRRVHINRA